MARRQWLTVVAAGLLVVVLLYHRDCGSPPSSAHLEHAPDGPRSVEAKRESTTPSALPAKPAEPQGASVASVFTEQDIDYLNTKAKVTAALLKMLVLQHTQQPLAQEPSPSPTFPQPNMAVLTLNLWGLSNDWPQRMQHIVAMLAAHPADLVGLQEVHRTGDGPATQASDLAKAANFPHTAYFAYHIDAENVQREEGLALLSKHPLTNARLLSLTGSPQTTDPNQRAALYALADVAGVGPCHVFVTHLTYDDKSQCIMMLGLLDMIGALVPPGSRVIVMGDFNTYFDYEWPMDFATGSLSMTLAAMEAVCPCAAFFSMVDAHRMTLWPRLRDSWSAVHKYEPGITFSGLPECLRSKDPCRPDRILHGSSDLAEVFAETIGNEEGILSDHRAVRVVYAKTS